jgi:diguanylate cyclase (GGDEF)-like protein
MSTAAIALLAAVAALLATVAIGLTVLRARRDSRRQLTAGLLEIDSRMDSLALELGAAVERVRKDALRARIIESLGQALDLDEVLARCAEAASALHGVTGAIAEIELDGEPLVASAGLAAGATGSVGGPPGHEPVRAIGISYHYAAEAAGGDLLRAAIAVPLESEGRRVGFLTVFGRGEEPPVTGDDFATLEAIARHTGTALQQARERTAPRSDPQTDTLTGLRNRLALHETLALDVARAHRHGRPLTLCLLDIDDFRRVNDSVGHAEADGVLTEVATLLREAIAPEHTAYRCGGDEFAVIMPAARRIDGEALCARLRGSLGRTAGSPAAGVRVSAGLAELKPDDDGVSLFERADRMLRRGNEGAGTAA